MQTDKDRQASGKGQRQHVCVCVCVCVCVFAHSLRYAIFQLLNSCLAFNVFLSTLVLNFWMFPDVDTLSPHYCKCQCFYSGKCSFYLTNFKLFVFLNSCARLFVLPLFLNRRSILFIANLKCYQISILFQNGFPRIKIAC